MGIIRDLAARLKGADKKRGVFTIRIKSSVVKEVCAQKILGRFYILHIWKEKKKGIHLHIVQGIS